MGKKKTKESRLGDDQCMAAGADFAARVNIGSIDEQERVFFGECLETIGSFEELEAFKSSPLKYASDRGIGEDVVTRIIEAYDEPIDPLLQALRDKAAKIRARGDTSGIVEGSAHTDKPFKLPKSARMGGTYGRLADVKETATRTGSIVGASEVSGTIENLMGELTSVQAGVRQAFQLFLSSLHGRAFETFEQNQEVAHAIQEMANRLNCLFRCPKCDEPSRLRCVKAGNARNGIFHFDHKIESSDGKHRRTTHGGKATLPQLDLVKKNAKTAVDQ